MAQLARIEEMERERMERERMERERMERERMEPMPGLQTYCHMSHPQPFRSHRAHSASQSASFNAAMPKSPNATRKDTGRDFANTMLDHSQSVYHSPSPESEIRFGNVDKGHSTASTSPYNGSSARTSRSSSSTSPSVNEGLADNDNPNISPSRVKLTYKKLTEILDSSQPERASDSKEKHKFDERRRRDIHKKLQGVAEDI